MDKLIRRGALIESLSQKKSIMVAEPDGKHSVSLETVIDYIGEYPTVDAVPVVHGKWLYNGFVKEWECSECHSSISLSDDRNSHPNFCPNCGADMRKKVQE